MEGLKKKKKKNGLLAKVKKNINQTRAGFAALRADKNMKKARTATSELRGYTKMQNKGGYSDTDLISGSNITYGAMKNVLGNRAINKTKKANRQYSKADRLMGY